MLKNLSVKNFAIIEDIDLDFKNGLTVLTGETGAGKSLIIDCISLLLGERANLEMIRSSEEKATITGTFTFNNIHLASLLDKLNIDYEDSTIKITRVISSIRSYIKINDTFITLTDLKSSAKYLADIHLQFDTTKLFNKENYLDIIDGFNSDLIDEYKTKYLSSLEELKIANQKYLSLVSRYEEIKKNREYYEFDLKELQGLNLKKDEIEEIKQQITYLRNYDQIYTLLGEIKDLIDKDSLSDVYKIKNRIKDLSSYQNEFVEMVSRIDSAYFEIEDIYESLSKKFTHLDYTPNQLDELETRLNELNLIQKKHNKTIDELIDYQKELEKLINSREDEEIYLNEEKEKLYLLFKNTYQYGEDLSKVRKQIAKKVTKELERHLEDLSLKSKFEIRFNEFKLTDDVDLSILLNTGIDDIDFYIETNVGEGLKPLNKIISGGEASRIMLAFKALFIKSNKIETVIFDEIDTGISGEVASKVANKIYEISLTSQVITITHLPQVASLSTNHVKISKFTKNGRTYTKIEELSLDDKIYEIALMISEGKVTPSQLEYAKEMVLSKK